MAKPTAKQILAEYGVKISPQKLGAFRRQRRIAEGPPYRMTIELPSEELTAAEEAERLALAEYNDDMGIVGLPEGGYIKLKAQTPEDARREALGVWRSQPEKEAIGYAICRRDWGCIYSYYSDRDGTDAEAANVRAGKA